MTKLYIPGSKLQMWEHQNAAQVDDLIEGTLNDDIYYCCKRGFALLLWSPVTTWTSRATIYYAPYKNREECEKLWEMWCNRREAAQYPTD